MNRREFQKYLTDCQRSREPGCLQKILEKTREAAIGLEYISEHNNQRDPIYYCRLCFVTSFTVSMYQHIVGLKHRMNYIGRKIDDRSELSVNTVTSLANTYEDTYGRLIERIKVYTDGPHIVFKEDARRAGFWENGELSHMHMQERQSSGRPLYPHSRPNTSSSGYKPHPYNNNNNNSTVRSNQFNTGSYHNNGPHSRWSPPMHYSAGIQGTVTRAPDFHQAQQSAHPLAATREHTSTHPLAYSNNNNNIAGSLSNHNNNTAASCSSSSNIHERSSLIQVPIVQGSNEKIKDECGTFRNSQENGCSNNDNSDSDSLIMIPPPELPLVTISDTDDE